jgi:hypothetical protein
MNASDNFRNEPDNIRKFPRKTVSPKRPSTIQPPGSTQFQAQKQHVVCLAVLPSKIRKGFDYNTILLPAIRAVLELDPYYWQVASANDNQYGETVPDNIRGWVEKEHPQVYILDMSDKSPEVIWTLGRLDEVGKEPPILIIVLERIGTKRNFEINGGIIRIEYTPSTGQHAINDIAKDLGRELNKRDSIQQLRDSTQHAHYLSPIFMQERGSLSREVAEVLSSIYKTMEAFAIAKPGNIRLYLHNRNFDEFAQGSVLGFQQRIRKHLKTIGNL